MQDWPLRLMLADALGHPGVLKVAFRKGATGSRGAGVSNAPATQARTTDLRKGASPPAPLACTPRQTLRHLGRHTSVSTCLAQCIGPTRRPGHPLQSRPSGRGFP